LDRVLEIGFGGGVNLPVLIPKSGFLAGIDPSQQMVEQAAKRFAGDVGCGRAAFRVGTVEDIPFHGVRFGKVCTVNTIYFWTSLEAGFEEIYRVLMPGGQAAIGFLPKEWMDRLGVPWDIFTPRRTEDVLAAAEKVGFSGISVRKPQPSTAWSVVLVRR
jgi:SAM-dependent methyltransferase